MIWQMRQRKCADGSGSYDEALCIISEYVEITSADEYEEETEEMGMEIEPKSIRWTQKGEKN